MPQNKIPEIKSSKEENLDLKIASEIPKPQSPFLRSEGNYPILPYNIFYKLLIPKWESALRIAELQLAFGFSNSLLRSSLNSLNPLKRCLERALLKSFTVHNTHIFHFHVTQVWLEIAGTNLESVIDWEAHTSDFINGHYVNILRRVFSFKPESLPSTDQALVPDNTNDSIEQNRPLLGKEAFLASKTNESVSQSKFALTKPCFNEYKQKGLEVLIGEEEEDSVHRNQTFSKIGIVLIVSGSKIFKMSLAAENNRIAKEIACLTFMANVMPGFLVQLSNIARSSISEKETE